MIPKLSSFERWAHSAKVAYNRQPSVFKFALFKASANESEWNCPPSSVTEPARVRIAWMFTPGSIIMYYEQLKLRADSL